MTLVREACKAGIIHFWSEGFHYNEKVAASHQNLYTWGGAKKNPSNENSINISVYEKWGSLRLKDLNLMQWLNENIGKGYTQPWML